MLAAVVATACTPTPTPRTVDVLGDSILTQAVWTRDDQWRAGVGFPEGADLFVDTRPGMRFEDLQPGEALRANDEEHPRPSILVIALGANNANPLEGKDGWTSADLAEFRKLLHTPHQTACVVVSLPAASPEADAAVLREFAEMRPAMEAEAMERPNTVVVDWADTVDDHPEYFAPDGVHLAFDEAPEGKSANRDAADAFNAHLWDGVARCPTPEAS